MMPHSLLVIPCYNERKRLDCEAFRCFAEVHPNILLLFVNDGSTDGTRELLDDLCRDPENSLLALHLDSNSGKAEAVRRGMLLASRLGVRYAGFWDADLATPLEAVPEFVTYLDENPEVLVVLGSRVQLLGRCIERRTTRHYLGRVFATFVSLMLGVPVYDTQCGAKLFRMEPEVTSLFDEPFHSRWIFDVEILARFLRGRGDRRKQANELIHEIPLKRWSDVGATKVRTKDFFKAPLELWTIHRKWNCDHPVVSEERPDVSPKNLNQVPAIDTLGRTSPPHVTSERS